VRLTRSDPDAEPLRDLPARQRLGYLVHSLAGWPQAGDAARRHPAPVRRMVEILGAEPTVAGNGPGGRMRGASAARAPSP
jgi:hypothetical protein